MPWTFSYPIPIWRARGGYSVSGSTRSTGGNGANGTATVSGGSVTAIAPTNSGTGYTTPPVVIISGGGGTGATAEAILTNGEVTGYVITNPGTGYTSAPTVTVEAIEVAIGVGGPQLIFTSEFGPAPIQLSASYNLANTGSTILITGTLAINSISDPVNVPVTVADAIGLSAISSIGDPVLVPVTVGDATTVQVSIVVSATDPVNVPVTVGDATTIISVQNQVEPILVPVNVGDATTTAADVNISAIADPVIVPVSVIEDMVVAFGLPTTILGPSGMTLITDSNYQDEVMSTINLPFAFSFYGANYNTLYVSSNGWIGVNNANQFSGFSTSSPSSRNIQISSSDGNVRFVYGKAESSNAYRIRFEGNSLYNIASTNKIYEVTFRSTGDISIVSASLGSETTNKRISKGDGVKFTDFVLGSTSFVHLTYNVGTDNYDIVSSGSIGTADPVTVPVTVQENIPIGTLLTYSVSEAMTSPGYYGSSYRWDKLNDGQVYPFSFGMMANVADVTFNLTLNNSSIIRRIRVFPGQFNGAFHIPQRLRVYTDAGLTNLIGTYSISVALDWTLISTESDTGFSTPRSTYYFRFDQTGSSNCSIYEIELYA